MIFSLLSAGLVIVLALAWLASLADLIWARWKKPHEVARSSAKVFAWLSATGVVTALLLWFMLFPPANQIYYVEFGEKPSPDVTHLHGLSEGGYDFRESQLCFQAAPGTIQRLVKIQKLPAIAPARSKHFDLTDSDAPKWWNPQIRPHSKVYAVERSKESDGFFRESVTLLYDPQTQTAYYWFSGID